MGRSGGDAISELAGGTSLPASGKLQSCMIQDASPEAWVVWMATNWGNIASVAGLALSVWVIVVAKRAKEAVDDLRQTFARRSLAQDLRDCGEDVSLVNVLTDGEKWDLAATTCYRIIQKISFLETRWSAHVDDDSRKAITVVGSQLETIISRYRRFRKQAPSALELQSVEDAILRVNTLLSSEVGKYEKRADE